jgi:hypothetical protein
MRSHSGAADARAFRARLGNAFETIEGTDGPKHMRGVGALPAPRAQQLLFPAQRQGTRSPLLLTP